MPNYKQVKGTNNGCIIGGILRHGKGRYGFKLVFEDLSVARKYKDMIFWIVKNDGLLERVDLGYFDDKEKKDYE